MTDNRLQQLKQLIEGNKSFVLTCHTNPDGDALGSTLGLRQVLLNMGKHATVISPDLAPTYFSWMTGIKTVKCYERDSDNCDKEIDECDVVVMMDFNDLKRIKTLGDKLLSTNKPKIMIDHHTDPQAECDVMLSYPEAPATCEVIYKALVEMGYEEYICADAATHFYTGLMTDTGGLSYNSSDPNIYRTIATILEKGVDKVMVHDRVFNSKSYKRIKLLGFCLSKKLHRINKLPITMMALNAEELERCNYTTGDTEGFVNQPLQVKDVIASILVLERPDAVKISIRSKGDFTVNDFLAKNYGGGGHKNAAGANYVGSFDECVKDLSEKISAYYKEWESRKK